MNALETDFIRLQCGDYEAKILPSVGGNLCGFRRGKVAALREPQSAQHLQQNPVVFGLPILFPPGRIDQGTFSYGGRTYPFPVTEAFSQCSIHGLLYDRVWDVESRQRDKDHDTATLCHRSDPKADYRAYYPHDFSIRQRFELGPQGLCQTVLLTNEGDRPMPFGLGFHSAFTLHMTESSRPQDVTMKVAVGKRIELNQRLLPTGRVLPLDELQSRLRTQGMDPLAADLNDHFTAEPLPLPDKPFYGAILEDAGAKTRILYEVDAAFKHWVIWNGKQEGSFVCIEPQTWRVNAPNLDLPEGESGMGVVLPGQTFAAKSRLAIETF